MTSWPTQARYAKSITPSDTVNNLVGARWLINTGTAGVFQVAQADPYSDVELYAAPGEAPLEVAASMLRVKLTGLGLGVQIVGYFD